LPTSSAFRTSNCRNYEGAVNRISAGALYQLALTLDVPVQYFFDV
jgi:hypothetical protein